MCNLSIIVPVYNSATKGLDRCLESILNQEYDDFELILVDDGSTDESLTICKEYADKDDRVLVISQQNEGVSSARNKGLQNATGDYVMFIDSDDVIRSNYISELMSCAGKSDLVVCGVIQHFCTGQQKTYTPPLGIYNVGDAKSIHKLVKSRLVFGPCNKVFKRKIIVDNRLEFPKGVDYGEDRIFCYEYLKHVKTFEGIDATYYDYLIQEGGSLSTKYIPNLFDLEYSQWLELKEMYAYHNCLTDEVRKDLFIELFWLVNDAVANLNIHNRLTRNNVKPIIGIPELEDVNDFIAGIATNRVMKFLIIHRKCQLIILYYKFLKLCKK